MNEKEMIEEMEKFIIKTRNILKNILLAGSRPVKNTSRKDCYFCLMNLQKLYKSNTSISDKDFLKILFDAKISEGSVVLDRQEYQKYCAYKIIEPQINGCLDRERELESENKDLQDLCNKTYDDLTKEIDRLEKENVELKVDLKNSIDMQKQMLDGFKTAIKEVEENISREIPNLLKWFAERVKMEFYYEFDELIPSIMSDKIDKILKEIIGE